MSARPRGGFLAALLAALMAALVLLPSAASAASVEEAGAVPTQAEQASQASAPLPVLAYYYIWFNPSSWERAKTDYPLLGTYSSDETAIMRQHIAMAKSAGIEGFLVSWKDTNVLTPRLERLMGVAREMNFKLGIVYQGLDFAREPLRIQKVQHDMQVFADRFAGDPVFDIFGQPVVIWTGTRDFSTEDVASVRQVLGDRVALFASAAEVEDYQRVAELVDGNAHYWGAVNPEKEWYPKRMSELAEAVHAQGDLVIAPAAPGFDARMVGGQSVVPRNGTETLATELEVAAGSGADAIGLISWNEFSENTHVEPSENFGKTALQEVARFVGNDPQRVMGVDSSTARGGGWSGLPGWVALLVTGAAVVGAVVLARRNFETSDARVSAEGYGW